MNALSLFYGEEVAPHSVFPLSGRGNYSWRRGRQLRDRGQAAWTLRERERQAMTDLKKIGRADQGTEGNQEREKQNKWRHRD